MGTKMEKKNYSATIVVPRDDDYCEEHTLGSAWKICVDSDDDSEKSFEVSIECIERFPAWRRASYVVESTEDDDNVGSIGIPLRASLTRSSKTLRFNNSDKYCTLTVKITEYYDPYPCMTVSDQKCFTEPANDSDVILCVGSAKLHVNKRSMASHSSFFDKLFFGDFAEKNKDEVELKDLDQGKFLEFLRAIDSGLPQVTWENLDVLLEMANRFGCQGLLRECMSFMCGDRDRSKIFEKLRLADHHHLPDMVDSIVKSMSGPVILSAFKFGSELYSDELLRRLSRRLGSVL